MTTPAVLESQSPLEAALLEVDAVLADLLVAADEQHAAVVAGDRERLESVTRRQEALSSRLGRAEGKRLSLLSGQSLAEAFADMPAPQAERLGSLSRSIGDAVRELQPRHARNGSLLARKAQSLRDAGLHRVTVSLDSLDEEVFAAVNDVGAPVARVLEGIEAAAVVDALDRVGGDAQAHVAAERVGNEGDVAQVRQEPALGLDIGVAHLVPG